MSWALYYADGAARKQYPIASGVLDYFPDALMAVALVSYLGNKQHNLGPLHWDRTKSTDEADALIRHFMQRGTVDTDGALHSAKMAWRALALLQKELESRKDKDTHVELKQDENEVYPALEPRPHS